MDENAFSADSFSTDAWEFFLGANNAGYRSLLAPWLGGGVSGVAPTQQVAYRSMLAPWVGGGATGAAPVQQVAVRSLLAPWMGGAVLGEFVEPGIEFPPSPAGVASGGPGTQIGLAEYKRRFGPPEHAPERAVAQPKRSRADRQRRQIVSMLMADVVAEF